MTSAIALLGLALYLAGHGTRGLPNGGLMGSIAMIVGGIMVALSLVVS
jgi:hypothetical protein